MYTIKTHPSSIQLITTSSMLYHGCSLVYGVVFGIEDVNISVKLLYTSAVVQTSECEKISFLVDSGYVKEIIMKSIYFFDTKH